MGLLFVDWMIATASVVAVFVIGLFASRVRRRSLESSPAEFFLAGQNMPWFISAASIFASNIGTEHFIGQAGLAATAGMAVCIYEWSAVYLLIMLAWIFSPVYLKNRLRTIPEYLELRFDRKCRTWFVIVTLFSYALTKIGCSLFSGAVVLDVLLDLNLWTSAPIILILTAIYTTFGGLTAVMFTDTLQCLIFLIGGFTGAFLLLYKIGGYSELKGILRERELHWFLHNIHPMNDKDFPWLGMSLGLGTVGISYWCTDQEIAQLVLSSKSLDHAQLGCMTAAAFKLTPFLITVLPGLIARAIYEKCLMSNGAEFGQWCVPGAEDMSDSSDSNKAYPLLVLREFPAGVKGLMVAAFLSAMMSSLSSVFNSASTIFTYDIYLRTFHPEGDVSPKRVVLVGRITTVVLTFIALLWVPVIQHSSDGLYLATQSASAHVLPPITAVFLVGLFWPRGNAKGAFSGFVLGSVVGLFRLGLSLIYQDYCDDRSQDIDGRSVIVKLRCLYLFLSVMSRITI
eukprot:g5283.t1